MTINDALDDAWKARGRGNYSEVEIILGQLEMQVDPADYFTLGRIHHIKMQVARDHGRLEEARAYCGKSIALYERSKNEDRIAHSRRHFADLLCDLNRLDEANTQYEYCISIYRKMNVPFSPDLANALRGYALLLEKMNRSASSTWQEVRSIYRHHNIIAGIAEADEHLKPD